MRNSPRSASYSLLADGRWSSYGCPPLHDLLVRKAPKYKPVEFDFLPSRGVSGCPGVANNDFVVFRKDVLHSNLQVWPALVGGFHHLPGGLRTDFYAGGFVVIQEIWAEIYQRNLGLLPVDEV